MPKVPAGKIPPEEVEEFTGLSRAALQSLSKSTAIPSLAALTSDDAVIARAMKSIFWTGPSVTRPGPDQQAIRTAALAARDGLSRLLNLINDVDDETDAEAIARQPEYACVVLSTGRVISARSADGAFDGMRSVTEPWICLPIGAWKREADLTWVTTDTMDILGARSSLM